MAGKSFEKLATDYADGENGPNISTDQDVIMPGVGTFHSRDTVLEWVGRSERNGQECALIDYRSFFNPLQLAVGGMTIQGRSDFWGEIWVSLATKQIEYATIL